MGCVSWRWWFDDFEHPKERRNKMANLKTCLFVIIVIGSVIVAARYQREMSVARERINNLGSQVIETGCGTIEYTRVGEGYPVLVIHGLMGGFDQGLLQAEFLDSKYQAIVVSRFGYLRSPMPEDANFNLQADLYACLLDELNISKVAVFGTSGGANSSIRFTARYPERTSALILMEPAVPGKDMPPTPPRFIFDSLLRSDFVFWAMTKIPFTRSFIEYTVGVPKGFILTPEMQTVVDRVVESTLPVSTRNDGMIFDMFYSGEMYEEISATAPYPLSEVETPVLLINTLDDPNSIPENVKNISEIFPHARLFVLPDGGHLTLGHEDEIKAEIAQFLSSNLENMNVLAAR